MSQSKHVLLDLAISAVLLNFIFFSGLASAQSSTPESPEISTWKRDLAGTLRIGDRVTMGALEPASSSAPRSASDPTGVEVKKIEKKSK